MKQLIFISVLLVVLNSSPLFAEEVPQDLPPPDVEQEGLEPEVTIIREEKRTTYEYRINGRLYMTKIVPNRGAPYYLLDLDGDGEMDTQQNDPGKIVVPQWVLLRW